MKHRGSEDTEKGKNQNLCAVRASVFQSALCFNLFDSLSPSRLDGQVHLNLSGLIFRDDVRLHAVFVQAASG